MVSMPGPLDEDLDWAGFLGEQDLVWGRMPRTWYEGPFLGNGFLGSILYQEPGTNALRFTIQHSEVQDHRPEIAGDQWGLARVPVGHVTLTPVGRITGVDLRLRLWDAEITGTVTTDRGTIRLRALVHNDHTMLLATADASAGERGFTWTYVPERPISPRIVRESPPAALIPNPDPVTSTVDGITLVTQPMLAGGETATACHETTDRTLYVAVAHSYPEVGAAAATVRTVRAAVEAGPDALTGTHRRWWHAFYRKSFISVPDAMMQSFYWIQLYKTACAARAEAPVMATTGPWLEPTPWPGVWWNLNVQLEYWHVLGANHPELDAIPRTLKDNERILIEGLRPEYREDSAGLRRSTDMFGDDAGNVQEAGTGGEIGDLPWALHNVWLHYRHTMDESILRDILFPLLRRAMNYYLHFLAPGEDGRLHLPSTFSPEYGAAPDCNYDLALIRWSCATLLDSAALLDIDDPLAKRWQEVLDTLVDSPVDENGFMIGTGVPFAMSHRHYSHLLSVYPLYLVTWEQPEHRDLIERSLRHWISFEGALRGYSFTGAASISAQMGRGDDALRFLRELVARFIQPNTMYYEAGPVIETPLSAAQSLHDMLCLSFGDTIRIFPAVPSAWADVTVHDFRTQGAFLVSAVRRGGRTRWVRVRSEAGEPCRLRPGIDGPLTVHGAQWRDLGDGRIELDLPRGGEALVFPEGSEPDLRIAPVEVTVPAHRWGLPALAPSGPTAPVDLAGLLDNDAVSNEFFMGNGDFDGTGRTYPAAQLPQTGHVTSDGVDFTFFNGSEGDPNNVIPAGQTVPLPAGRYARLHVLGAGDTGNAETVATVSYLDGLTVEATVRLTGWLSDPAFDESVAVRTRQIHTRTGASDVQAAIFHQVVALDAGRDVASVSFAAATGPRPHIFALTLERA
jgi:alpha-L-fucosidase 2